MRLTFLITALLFCAVLTACATGPTLEELHAQRIECRAMKAANCDYYDEAIAEEQRRIARAQDAGPRCKYQSDILVCNSGTDYCRCMSRDQLGSIFRRY